MILASTPENSSTPKTESWLHIPDVQMLASGDPLLMQGFPCIA